MFQIVYWEDKSMYIEQNFVRLSDGFVYAVMYAKYTIIGCDSIEKVSNPSSERLLPNKVNFVPKDYCK